MKAEAEKPNYLNIILKGHIHEIETTYPQTDVPKQKKAFSWGPRPVPRCDRTQDEQSKPRPDQFPGCHRQRIQLAHLLDVIPKPILEHT